MKKLFLVAIIAITLFSCGNKEDENKNNFSISGTVKEADGEKLILSKFIIGSKDGAKAIDTAEVKEGKFSFNGKVKDAEFYTLSFLGKDTKRITFVLDSADNIIFDINAADFPKNYKVEGSKDSKLLQELYDHFEVTLTKMDTLQNFANQNLDKLKDDKELNERINTAFLDILGSQQKYSKKFIDENSNTMASLLALLQSIDQNTQVFSFKDDMAYWDKVNNALAETHPKSESVKALSGYLKQIKLQIAQEKIAKQGALGIGNEAPEISENTTAGKPLALSSLRGKYVLIDFWASWCRPCRGESPTLVANYAKYKNKGFTIYQVSLDKTKDAWFKAIKKDKLGAWHHVSDLQFWNCAPAKLYGVRSIPANFLIDPDGKIIAMNLRGERLGEKLKEIFKY